MDFEEELLLVFEFVGEAEELPLGHLLLGGVFLGFFLFGFLLLFLLRFFLLLFLRFLILLFGLFLLFLWFLIRPRMPNV